KLSCVFGYIFILISFISIIYALNVKDDLQYVAGFVYAGGALGVAFSGDFFSLYVFWEIMAVASTFLILARKTPQSQRAAFRYILVHIVGGLFLLAGIVIQIVKTGDITFGYMELKGLGAWLIFLGIAVNAAIPPLHPWLKDAYPEATIAGAVFLSAFTTKSAVYVMARVFPGAEILIWLGAFMTIYPIFYAEVENDMRRVLSYSIINQVGFMMCGVGIGTQLALNGTVSHAFAHILYKALLFMSVGSVIHVTGKSKATDLGGLYRTMPITCIFCLVGALSISAFPLTGGFISKSMILSASGHEHLTLIWFVLQFASAGVIAHAGIKVPFFTFFGHDSGIRAKEPPVNMLIGMGMAAFMCIFLGIFPGFLYNILPYPVDYVPYSGAHVVGQLQLLMFAVLAFYFLLKSGRYPDEIRAINIDVDWFYRKPLNRLNTLVADCLNRINASADKVIVKELTGSVLEFTKNAPANIVRYILASVLNKKGTSSVEGDPAEAGKKVVTAFETNTVPVGVFAACATLFIVVLFFLI
ncbi:MAG: Na(+)/H(+) antiporter subunit D, partial [Thermodesulfobacteriota bacterium]|nr:Na(+)/H(+) antiporter subunit D [Thermodesulfobacteriota bacterium]